MDELTVQIDQVTKLTDRFKSSQEHFKRFLMTYNSEKAIYWLPKEHNEKTTKLLQNREPEVFIHYQYMLAYTRFAYYRF